LNCSFFDFRIRDYSFLLHISTSLYNNDKIMQKMK